MNPVKTMEVREWERIGHTVMVPDDNYGMGHAAHFCSRCGAPTVIVIEQRKGYDSETGKRLLEATVACPNRSTNPWLPWSKHARQWVRLSQKLQQELLYKYALDTALPDSG